MSIVGSQERVLAGIAKERTSCRSCGEESLFDLLSLGDMCPVGFVENSEKKVVVKVPLTLCLCSNCRLVQLRHTTNPDLLYREWYGYRSGVNERMVADLELITKSAETIVKLKPGDIVLDIGCNDGTLLSKYSNRDIIRVGFDPARNVARYAPEVLGEFGVKNYKIFFDFFSRLPFQKYFGDKKAKAVTAISMFYDLDDPNGFLENVKIVLHPEGFLIIQQNYLVEMLRQCAFDNICHEHLVYHSLSSLSKLLEKHGLEIFDVTTSEINGGSFRTYVRHKDSNVTVNGGKERVRLMLKNEKNIGLLAEDVKVYERFIQKVQKNTKVLREFVEREVKQGKKIYIYAASTRGNTILQFVGLDSKLITAAAERNPDKWGRRIVGTNIPIVSESEARVSHPDYFLVLPWFLRDSFIKREKKYLESGGKMIFPLPEVEVVGMEGKQIMSLFLKSKNADKK